MTMVLVRQPDIQPIQHPHLHHANQQHQHDETDANNGLAMTRAGPIVLFFIGGKPHGIRQLTVGVLCVVGIRYVCVERSGSCIPVWSWLFLYRLLLLLVQLRCFQNQQVNGFIK